MTINSLLSGNIINICVSKNGKTEIIIESLTGQKLVQTVHRGLEILVKVNQKVDFEQPLTLDPNVGGFGQSEINIIFQKNKRIQTLILFLFSVSFNQIFFVLKKKQFEKVQEIELNF